MPCLIAVALFILAPSSYGAENPDYLAQEIVQLRGAYQKYREMHNGKPKTGYSALSENERQDMLLYIGAVITLNPEGIALTPHALQRVTEVQANALDLDLYDIQQLHSRAYYSFGKFKTYRLRLSELLNPASQASLADQSQKNGQSELPTIEILAANYRRYKQMGRPRIAYREITKEEQYLVNLYVVISLMQAERTRLISGTMHLMSELDLQDLPVSAHDIRQLYLRTTTEIPRLKREAEQILLGTSKHSISEGQDTSLDMALTNTVPPAPKKVEEDSLASQRRAVADALERLLAAEPDPLCKEVWAGMIATVKSLKR